MSWGMRSKGMRSPLISALSGLLSSSERGRMRLQRAKAQPSDSSVNQCAPLRSTLSESAL